MTDGGAAGPESGPTGRERRKHRRFPVGFALQVREGPRLIGTVEDISEGGIRIRLDDEVGENEEVREWTGHKGVSNREFVLNNMVGNEFTFQMYYMGLSMGEFQARLVRVIRSMTKLFFAMQFTDVNPRMVSRVMAIVRKRAAAGQG
ncbi:MAG: PilZ domain-containing protein [Candidatus Hydrogenedentota bacterium]|nr:MAG: PilZ domain-containing protein [Candidatus Hydrogenedentota bacterium]